jgi:PTS system nitrogen regulatory IIA component
MELTPYLWKDGIQFCHADDKNQALEQIIERASSHPAVSAPKALAEGIRGREMIISTGIGLGVAIPHAKIGGISEFFICVTILDKGINWNAIDDEPVRIIFLIAGPVQQQNLYLQLLARLSQTIKNPDKRAAILAANTPESLMALLSES